MRNTKSLHCVLISLVQLYVLLSQFVLNGCLRSAEEDEDASLSNLVSDLVSWEGLWQYLSII